MLAALVALPLTTQAAFINFTATLTGPQENPANGSIAIGSATGILDTSTNELIWTVTANGLSLGTSRAHFHGLTDPPPNHTDDNCGILLAFIDLVTPALVDPDVVHVLDTLTGNTSGVYVGRVDLDLVPSASANLAGLLNNQWYINIHDGEFGGGEIRGQFFRSVAVPLPAGLWLLSSAFAALPLIKRRQAAA